MGSDHTTQENFIPLRHVYMRGGNQLDAIAESAGVPVSEIVAAEWFEDPCHLGLFLHRLVVKGQHGRRPDDHAA